MEFVNERHGTKLADYAALHRFSVDRMEEFWVAVWDFCGVIAETRGETVIGAVPRTVIRPVQGALHTFGR